jgi:hypothetical protein
MRSPHALEALVLVLALTGLACTTHTEPSSATASGSEPVDAVSTEAPASKPEAEVPSGPPGGAVALAEGQSFACVLQRAGTVACWGNNASGQLGQGHHDSIEGAVLVPGLDDVTAIAAGNQAACAVRRSGSVTCWGSATLGALGNGGDADFRGFVEVPGVQHATELSASSFTFCAITPSGTWCWGSQAGMQVVMPTVETNDYGPWRLTLEDVRALNLGDDRSFAWRDDGSVLAWTSMQSPVVVPDVVVASSGYKIECLVHASGEVICSREGEGDLVLAPLRGARQLFRTSTIVAGLLPDGTLVGASLFPKSRQPVFEDARDLVTITNGQQDDIHGIRRDGRVFVWEGDVYGKFVAREIVLPPPSALSLAGRPPTLPDTKIPSWCAIETRVVSPVDVGSLADVVGTALGPDEREHEALCWSLGIDSRSADCPASGPWFVRQSNEEVALIVPLGAGKFARIPKLAEVSEGTEVLSIEKDLAIRSSQPVDAWLWMSEGEGGCFDQGDEELCGISDTFDKHFVIAGLGEGTFLVVQVTIDMQKIALEKREELGHAPRVQISGGRLDVWACGGRARLPLPSPVESSALEPSVPEPSPTAPSLPPASADEAATAGKRCNEGWSKFKAGELAAAKLDVDAALTVLERARDEKGSRSLGACLYNRGRIAEQEGQIVEARELYRRSLAARPNDTVSARLDSLMR